MKKTNKGFSMVELIIVIAIMAILAGALAPALIKYINKSRISTDIQTANTIATAVQTALANETAYDEASPLNGSWTVLSTVCSTGSVFGSLVTDTLGGNTPSLKAKKCLAPTGTQLGTDFYVNITGSNVEVREGSASGHRLYPTAAKCLTDDGATCAP
ncbi:MAG: type II secretion system GspH family protein [Lachnospiraceae bacterium]|nr:type II secretion system GspH family protein [Lachnospiraceae bacterium]